MTTPKKQTGPAISSIAAKYARLSGKNAAALVRTMAVELLQNGDQHLGPEGLAFFEGLRKVCASLLSQDETKGQGK